MVLPVHTEPHLSQHMIQTEGTPTPFPASVSCNLVLIMAVYFQTPAGQRQNLFHINQWLQIALGTPPRSMGMPFSLTSEPFPCYSLYLSYLSLSFLRPFTLSNSYSSFRSQVFPQRRLHRPLAPPSELDALPQGHINPSTFLSYDYTLWYLLVWLSLSPGRFNPVKVGIIR